MITIELDDELYKKLIQTGVLDISNHKLKQVEPSYDYSHDEQWQDLKKQSIKIYKALKEHEFKIRHGN